MPSLIFGGGMPQQYGGGSLIQPFQVPGPFAVPQPGEAHSGLDFASQVPSFSSPSSPSGPSGLDPWGYNSRELGQTPTAWADTPAWLRGGLGTIGAGAATLFGGPLAGSLVGGAFDVADSRAGGAGWGEALGSAAAGAVGSETGVPGVGSIVDWFRNRFGGGEPSGEMVGPPEAPPQRGAIPPPDMGATQAGFSMQGPVTAGSLLNAWNTSNFYGAGDFYNQNVFDWTRA